MILLSILDEIPLYTLIAITGLAFIAGFLDAVVGGGGLIQLPALLINFPKEPIATLFGTNKIAAFSGTSVAAFGYAKRIRFNPALLLVISLAAFGASYLGAKAVSKLDVSILKPVILVILIAIAIYTYFKKELGAEKTKSLPTRQLLLYGALIGIVVGFYDGFFGPGTGSFLVLGFVVILGFDFLHASAYAKIVNCFTNFSALLVFIKQGNYLLSVAIVMAAFNVLGNILGTKMALKRGNGFVRIVFLVIVGIMIIRYAYDVFTLKN